MAREYATSIAFDELPPLLERLLAAYLAPSPSRRPRSFFEFCRRHEIAACATRRARARLGARGHERDRAHPAIIPENAPFSTEQRAWLNGFFAGLSRRERRERGRGRAAAPAEPRRLPLARCGAVARRAARPRRRTAKPERQLMAAMAQLDCGQCGYLCQTYAEAVWSGAEADMGRCVPGGKETQRKVKELVAALEPMRDGSAVAAPVGEAAPARSASRATGRALGHPGRRPSAQSQRLREGRASRRARPLGERRHLRGGRQSRRLRAQEPATRAGRARSAGRHRRGDGRRRRRGAAAAPGAAQQGRHRAAQRRMHAVPGDPRLRRRGGAEAAGAGRGRGTAGTGRGRPARSAAWPSPRCRPRCPAC